MRILTALIVLMLIPNAVGWGQLRGDADRSPSIAPPPGTLDVAEIVNLAPGEGHLHGLLSPLAVSADGDVVVLSITDAGFCQISRWNPGSEPRYSRLDSDCEDGWLQGVWQQEGLILVCQGGAGTDPILAAFDRAGEYLWGVVPDLDLQLDTGSTVGDWAWSCQGTAINQQTGEAVVPFVATQTGSEGSRHRIAKIALSEGSVLWTTTVQPAALHAALDSAGLDAGDGINPAFMPIAMTAIETGYMASGFVRSEVYCGPLQCPDPQDTGTRAVAGVAWFNALGQTQQIEVPTPRQNPSPEVVEPVQYYPLASSFGAGQGSLIATQVGGRILIVDPTTPNLEHFESATVRESGASLAMWTGPLWQHQRLVVPTERSLTFLDPVSFELLPSPPGPELRTERIVDLAGDRLGRLYVLTADVTDDTSTNGQDVGLTAKVRIIDADGATNHELKLPAITRVATHDVFTTDRFGEEGFLWLQTPMFVEHDNGLMVTDARGTVFMLDNRPDVARIDVSNLFPRSGDSVDVVVQRFGNPVEVVIRWGDGITETTAWNAQDAELRASHLYVEPQRTNLLVTLVDEDGTTATSTFTMDVGGTPPPVLNIIQKAFSPRYQDTTWGIIGLVVALLGILYGYVRLSGHRRRLNRALDELDAIRDAGGHDPVAALVALGEARERHASDASLGRFDQGQLHVLERRAAATGRSLFFSCVEPFRERLTPGYQAMLAAFFEDGRIGPHEATSGITGAAKQKRLTEAERQTLTRMFRVFVP